jgi:hypothetical protein
LLRSRLIPLVVLLGPGLGALPLACGNDTVRSPFGPGAGGGDNEPGAGAPGSAGFKLDVDAGSEVDPTLGGPCQDDGQCDDRVDCTQDACDQTIGRCRFTPADDVCDDLQYCNGVERCDVRDGCVFGEPVACSDNTTCTIDVCVEETQSCRNDPRDADGDGDPTHNCGGLDCDDRNPVVSSSASEICGNKRDDDCDGASDEQDCVAPEFDKCAAPLEISASGYFDVDLTGTLLDYPTACAREDSGFRDAVLRVSVPEGGPFDLDVVAKLDSGRVTLATAASCGDGTTTSCEPSYTSPIGASVSRLLLRGLTAGDYPVYLAADVEATALLHVELREAEAQLGELCEEAVSLSPGAEPVLLRLTGYEPDVDSACLPLLADAFVSFTLDEARDVTVIAEAQRELGLPVLTLLDEACQAELTCRRSQPGRLFARDLSPGSYRVAVGATGPDDVSVRLETAPVSETPPGEGCDNASALEPGVEELVDLSIHEDAVDPGCQAGSPDATFSFELGGARDVALVGRFSAGDTGAVSITRDECSGNLVCKSGGVTQRALRFGLSAGSYRAVIESARGNPVGLSFFERPVLAAVHVPFADDCAELVTIPELGGRFSGNTSNAFPDYSGGCDVGGQDEGGAPDQILKLSLTQSRRVIFDMQGSGYETMLSVRGGPTCPGTELTRACATGLRPGKSYLDLDLEAGDYFVQIDGYDGDSGAWNLNVFTAPL